MRSRVVALVVVVCSAILAVAGGAFAQDTASAVTLTRAEQEVFLRTAEILKTEVSTVGVTQPKNATMSDGTVTHQAQIQDVDIFEREFETVHGTEFNFRDSYKYNIAAYLLDKHLDLKMVPVSVERKVGSSTAALTWWVDDVIMTEWDRAEQKLRSPNPRTWAPQMYACRMFDQLIDNTDRNGGNLIITADWNIWMIDHTRAFRTRKRLRAPNDLEWVDRNMLEKLRTLDEATLTELLSEYLTGSEIEGLVSRAQLMVELYDQRIADLGAGASCTTCRRGEPLPSAAGGEGGRPIAKPARRSSGGHPLLTEVFELAAERHLVEPQVDPHVAELLVRQRRVR